MPILGITASSILKSTASFESIASANGTGSAGNITFSSIPATYKHLQIRYISKDTSTAGDTILNPEIRFNSDSGSNYAYHEIRGNGSGVDANRGATQTKIIIMGSSLREVSASNIFGVAIVDIQNYSSTTQNKTLRYFSGIDTNNGAAGQRVSLGSGLWINTAAITSIEIIPGVSNFTTTSTFALYGIKG